MDTRRAKWFIYVRYQSTWQIATPSLSTVTIYYNHIPLEIQRGWLVNYFGTKVVVREGETKVSAGPSAGPRAGPRAFGLSFSVLDYLHSPVLYKERG